MGNLADPFFITKYKCPSKYNKALWKIGVRTHSHLKFTFDEQKQFFDNAQRVYCTVLPQCTMEFEGTFNLGVDQLNMMIVPSRFYKTLEHV